MLRRVFGTSLLAVVAVSESKLDSTTFTKLVLENKSSDSFIIHFKKKDGWDSAELTQKVGDALIATKDALIFNLELDSEAPPEPEEGAEEETEWQIKERVSKTRDLNLMGRISLNPEDLPKMAVFRSGKMVASMPIKTDDSSKPQGEDAEEPQGEDAEEPSATTIEHVTSFLSEQSIELDFDSQDFEEDVLPEDFLDKFLSSEKASEKKDYDALLKEAQELMASEADDVDTESKAAKKKQLKSAMWIKVLKSAVKNAKADGAPAVKTYVDKELKRVTNMLGTNSITKNKKDEMSTKVKCLKTLEKKISNM